MLRGFYALEQTRTVFWIQCVIAATNIAARAAAGPRGAPPRTPRRRWCSPTPRRTSSGAGVSYLGARAAPSADSAPPPGAVPGPARRRGSAVHRRGATASAGCSPASARTRPWRIALLRGVSVAARRRGRLPAAGAGLPTRGGDRGAGHGGPATALPTPGLRRPTMTSTEPVRRGRSVPQSDQTGRRPRRPVPPGRPAQRERERPVLAGPRPGAGPARRTALHRRGRRPCRRA